MDAIRLNNVPVLDGRETVLLCNEGGMRGDCFIAQRSACGDGERVIASYDAMTGNAYPACEAAWSDGGVEHDAAAAPIVRIVGDLSGDTGQVTILQEDGTYRRYSRWDRISMTTPKQPNAIVRTLPQCGCGGYLGAPMMFDSFAEMTAYFLVVFSHAAHDGASCALEA